MTKIHQRRDLYALMRRREAEIIDGVMWDGEGMKVDFANAKILARFDLLDAILESFSAFSRFFVVDVGALAYVGITGLGGDVDGTIHGAQQHAQTAGVVAMLMCDENCIEFLHVLA